jgi:acyl carrier protein
MTSLRAEAVKETMLAILQPHLPGVSSRIDDSTNLVAEGLVDSLGFIELIAELERRLDLEIDLVDMDPEQLTIVGPLAAYITARGRRA